MNLKPEPKPMLVQPDAQVLHVVWLVQPAQIHGSLAGSAGRPSTIKQYFTKFGWFSRSLKCLLQPDDDRKR